MEQTHRADLYCAFFHHLFFVVFFTFHVFNPYRCPVFYRTSAIPIVGPLNSVLGGCVGAVEGVLYLYLMVAIASLVLALTGDSIPYLNRQTLESTWILRLFLEKSA